MTPTMYKCIQGFYLENEINKDGYLKNREENYHVARESLWFWKKEQGELINAENYRHDEILINRSDFVKHFERTGK